MAGQEIDRTPCPAAPAHPYRKPARYDYNLLVIGAGAGGLVTSYIAAAVKAKVALIEKHKMGAIASTAAASPPRH